MTTFFTILISLVLLNAILLIFSHNGAYEKFRKPIKRISETPIPKLFPQEYGNTEYKKAV